MAYRVWYYDHKYTHHRPAWHSKTRKLLTFSNESIQFIEYWIESRLSNIELDRVSQVENHPKQIIFEYT